MTKIEAIEKLPLEERRRRISEGMQRHWRKRWAKQEARFAQKIAPKLVKKTGDKK